MLEHKEEIKNERLSDAELTEMRAMLFVWEKVPSSFFLFMSELSKVATDEMKDSGEWQIIAAAPESMGKLLGEVERLQREQHKHDPNFCYECQGVQVLLPVTLITGLEASDD